MKRNKKSIFALCSFEPTIFKMRGLPMGRYAGNILPRFFNAPDERVTPRNLIDSAECPMRGNNWTPADPFFISFLSQKFFRSMSASLAPIWCYGIVLMCHNVLWLCVRWGFSALKPIDSTNFKYSTNDYR